MKNPTMGQALLHLVQWIDNIAEVWPGDLDKMLAAKPEGWPDVDHFRGMAKRKQAKRDARSS